MANNLPCPHPSPRRSNPHVHWAYDEYLPRRVSSSSSPPCLFAPTPAEVWDKDLEPPQNPRQLLIPYAVRGGKLVHVSEVESGLRIDCLCSNCGEGLVAKKGERVIHHFAHRPKSTCNGETVLHRTAKLMLAERLEQCIREGMDLRISWYCSLCQSSHTGNLAKVAASLEVEKPLGSVRPDILLLDQQGNPRVAVEVVVTHPPEPRTVDFYSSNGITLVIVVARTLEELELLRSNPELYVNGVKACTRKKCPHCRSPLWWRLLLIKHSRCHICRGDIFAAEAILNRDPLPCNYTASHSARGPFLPADRRLIASHGIPLSWAEEDPSRVCLTCRYSVMEVYFRRHRTAPIEKIIPVGMYCSACEELFPDVRCQVNTESSSSAQT